MVLKHGCIAVIVVLLATSCDLLSSGDNGATDTTPPKVVSVTPENGADEVQVTTTVRAKFNEAIDPETVNPSTFIVRRSAATVAGTRSVDSATVWFEPADSLQRDMEYTLAVTHVTDKHGNTMQDTTRYSWHTVAGDTPSEDTHPPEVVHRTPANNADDVSVATQVKAVFSEPVVYDNGDPLQLVTEDNATVAARVNLQDTTVTLDPTDSLQYAHTYTAKFKSGITDTAGNALNASSWSFTTEDAPETDTQAPRLVRTEPNDGATGVSVKVHPRARFNERIDATTADATVTAGDTAAAVNVKVSGGTIYIYPENKLAYATEYTVKLPDTIADTAGNTFAGYQWSFTTEEDTNTNAWQLPDSRISYIDTDAAGYVYVNAWSKQRVAQFNPLGNTEWVYRINKGAGPNGLLVANKRMYVAYSAVIDYPEDETVFIETRDAETGELLHRISNIDWESVRDIVPGPNNTVYVITPKYGGILQLDKQGQIVNRTEYWFGGTVHTAAYDPTTNHLYLAGGKGVTRNGVLNNDVFLIKVDENLNEVWSTTYGAAMDTTGDTIYHQDFPHIEIAPSKNRLYVAGSAASTDGGEQAFVLGYNTDGTRAWEHVYEHSRRPLGSAIDTDGSFYIIGEMKLSPAKFAADGTLLWKAENRLKPPNNASDVMDIAVYRSTVFAVNNKSTIYRFDAQTGERK